MCHVLIIEDEWIIVDYLTVLVEKAGATSVATAATEADAVRAAHRHKPAIILSDVRLRAGTGPKAVEAITAEAGPIPVIFITGSPEDCRPCNPPGIILPKPINAHRLTTAFREMVAVGNTLA